jgi:hypothetical protein
MILHVWKSFIMFVSVPVGGVKVGVKLRTGGNESDSYLRCLISWVSSEGHVLKHFSQIDDLRSKYLERRHFYHDFNGKIVAELSSQLATDASL